MNVTVTWMIRACEVIHSDACWHVCLHTLTCLHIAYFLFTLECWVHTRWCQGDALSATPWVRRYDPADEAAIRWNVLPIPTGLPFTSLRPVSRNHQTTTHRIFPLPRWPSVSLESALQTKRRPGGEMRRWTEWTKGMTEGVLLPLLAAALCVATLLLSL